MGGRVMFTRISSRTIPFVYRVGDRWAVQAHPKRRTLCPNWPAAILTALTIVEQRRKALSNPRTREFREAALIGPKIYPHLRDCPFRRYR